jgi:hypothetical protein
VLQPIANYAVAEHELKHEHKHHHHDNA